MDAVTIENISKRFRNVTALDRVGFAVPQGSIFGLLGPNGAGKTTLMRILVGILGPDEGRIQISGDSTRRLKERMGYLPEERGLYPKMKIKDLVQFCTRIKGLSKSQVQERLTHGLERIGLLGQENRKVEELSKGNQQRVQLLITLLHEPDILVLDEPFSGLDPIASEQMKRILIEETERGATVIISTHSMEDAEQLCRNITLIHRGRIIRTGPLDQIKAAESRNEMIVEYEGDASAITAISGVVPVAVEDRRFRLRLSDGLSPPELIRTLSERVDVYSVNRIESSLHDIFVDLVENEENRR